MAIDLSTITAVNWKSAQQTQLKALPVQSNRPIPSGRSPSTITVPVDWFDYSPSFTNNEIAVAMDVTPVAQAGSQFDKIRSVKIDNTYNAVPMSLQFPDTLDTVTCPPNSVVISPVFTNALQAVLYGTEFYSYRPPLTTVEFANFDRSGASFLNGSLNPVKIVTSGGAQLNTVVGTVVSATYSLPPSVFPERADRGCYLVAFVKGSAAGVIAFLSATLNGVNLTGALGNKAQVFFNHLFNPPGTVQSTAVALWFPYPATASATISMTFNSSVVLESVLAFTIYNGSGARNKQNSTGTPTYLTNETLEPSSWSLAPSNLAISSGFNAATQGLMTPGSTGLFIAARNLGTFGVPTWSGGPQPIATFVDASNIEYSIAKQSFDDQHKSMFAAIDNAQMLIGAIFS